MEEFLIRDTSGNPKFSASDFLSGEFKSSESESRFRNSSFQFGKIESNSNAKLNLLKVTGHMFRELGGGPHDVIPRPWHARL